MKTSIHSSLLSAAVAALAAVAVASTASCGGDSNNGTTTATGTGGSAGSTSQSSGSGGREPPDTGNCSPDGWCWSLPTPTGAEFDSVWRDEKGVSWVVGEHGTILSHDEAGWHSSKSGTITDLHSVFGTSPADIWAVGEASTILHYDGKSWKADKAPGSGMPTALYAVWTDKKNDVWAGGEAGTLFHYNGTKWSTAMAATGFSIRAIVGGASLVYAADDSGQVSAWDGTSWSAILQSGQAAAALAFSPPSDVWCLSAVGGLFHSADNMNWTGVSLPAAVWSSLVVDGPRIWCGGDDVALYDTSAMTPAAVLVSAPEHARLGGAVEANGGPLFVGGSGEALQWSNSDKSWTRFGSGNPADRLALRGDEKGRVGAVGDEVVLGDGASWSVSDTGTERALYGLDFDPKGDAWAVGTGGTVIHQSGSSWKEVDVETFAWLHAIWFGKKSAWIVGDGGLALTQFQSAWQPVTTGTTQVLHAVHGVSDDAVWAVGEGGIILFWNGTSWKPQPNGLPDGGITASLRGVWAREKNDVWIAGGSGVLLHYNGKNWKSVGDANATYSLYSIWSGAADDAYAAGTSGTLLHYDGKHWKPQDPGTDATLNTIWGNGSGDVWVGGEEGVILHKSEGK